MSRSESHFFQQNRLLARLPRADLQRLRPYLEIVELPFKQVLYPSGEPIEHIYFPLAGLVSWLRPMNDGGSVETVSFGRDGTVGLREFFSATALAHLVVQIPGRACRLSIDRLTAEASPGSALLEGLNRFSFGLMNQLAQLVACNALHSVHQRCCRGLLTALDSVPGSSFTLTQEFLAQLLGVRRASVTEVARQLQREGVIEYQRGVVHVPERKALESEACECYPLIREEFERLLG